MSDEILKDSGQEANASGHQLEIQSEDPLAKLEISLKEFNEKASRDDESTDSNKKEENKKVTEQSKTPEAVPPIDGKNGSDQEPEEKRSSPTIAMPPPRNILTQSQLQESSLASNWLSVGIHRCPKCKFSTSEKALFTNHVTTCAPKPDKPADTSVKTSSNQQEAASGNASEKESIQFAFQNEYFKCVTCDRQWKSREEFEEHVVCHVIDEPYICITCSETFDRRQLLEKHARTTHPNGDSKCGLRGIKKAKRKVEDLEKLSMLTVMGKKISGVSNHQIKIPEPKAKVTVPNLFKERKLAEERLQNFIKPTSQNGDKGTPQTPFIISAHIPNADSTPINVTSNSSTDCTLSTVLSSGQSAVVEASAQNHKHSLFGVIHKQTNNLTPVSVPVSIQKIAPILSTSAIGTANKSDTGKYKVKDIKEYIKPAYVPPNGTPPSNPQSQVVIIPFGPPVTVFAPIQHSLPLYGTGHSQSGHISQPNTSNTAVVQRLPVILSTNTPVVQQTRPQGVVLAQPPSGIVTLVNFPQNASGPSVVAQAATNATHVNTNKLKNDYTASLRAKLDQEAQDNLRQKLNVRDPKKYLFRIKPGQGFVCEACRKFTRDELVFRRHVWEHFHSKPCVCKTCTPQNIDKKFVLGCQLVNNITCNLIKRSTEENAANTSKPVTEIISISDDENEEEVAKDNKKSHSAEVVLLEDGHDSDAGLKIKISSSYSLTNLSDSKNLEQMNSKEDSAMTKFESEPKANSVEENEKPLKQDSTINQGLLTGREATIDAELLTPNVLAAKGIEHENNINEEENEKEVTEQLYSVSEDKAQEGESQKVRDKKRELMTKEENEIMNAQPNKVFYMCGFEHCSFSCLMSNKYRAHLQEKHASAFNYVCSHCGQKDYSEDSHLRHMFSHANSKKFMLYPCPIRLCKYQTNMLKTYMDHFVIHKADAMSLKCVYCHKTFPDVESLVCHLRENLLKFVSCPHCTFKFAHRESVSRHIKMAHPEKPNLVTVTSQIVCLEREINFYVAPDKICEDLQQKALDIDIPALLEEVQKVGLENNDVNVNNSKSNIAAEKNLVADIEPDGFQNNHSQEATTSDQLRPPKAKEKINTTTGPKSLKCPHCSYLSHNQSYYVQHISIHDKEPQREKRFVCHICPKGLDNYHQLKRHVMNHIGRNQIKMFRCILCSYTSNQKYHIMDHCSDNHEGKGQYAEELEVVISNETACKYCEFRARAPEHVVQHELLVHDATTKESANSDECDDVPAKQPDEKESEATKKRKYHCDYCKGFFKHKVDLKEHMQNGHKDIESKQFTFYKCKHCSYTSTMKECILSHFQKDHKGKQLRILRKIEKVETPKSEIVNEKGLKGSADKLGYTKCSENESSVSTDAEKEKEEVSIPDGNSFKQPFKCPKCVFSSSLRINVIRHIKLHPELKPVRQMKVSQKPSKSTARKSTSRRSGETNTNPGSSLIQDIPKTSVPLSNPFLTVKEVVCELEKEGSNYEDYQLGEKTLHMKLFSCFKHLEEENKFKCLICKQKITKKFVLHRHILDHLKIVFFKCKYCGDGKIEQSLMTAHIQKEHHSMPVKYDRIGSAELDMQLAERISTQDFSGQSAEVKAQSDGSDSVIDVPGHIVKKQVHEAISIDDEVEERPPSKTSSLLSCDKCKYTSKRSDYLQSHVLSHDDPEKCFYCSVCFYRGTRFGVIKHMYGSSCRSESGSCIKDDSGSNSSQDSGTHKQSTDLSKLKNKADDQEQVQQTNSAKVMVEMKTVFKCKECGFKRESKSALYRHLKSSCKGPRYQCSICSFQNKTKQAIKVHARLRHPGKKHTVVDLPTNAKFKEIKVAIKPGDVLKEKETPSKAISPEDTCRTLDMLAQEKRHQCQICSEYVSNNVMTLQFHINTAHGGNMLYCQECSYKTPIVKHMMNHCNHVHRQQAALYKLHPKDKEVNESNRNTSQDIDDTTDCTWTCPSCPYKNTKKESVKKHIITHLNLKPYMCKHCGKSISNLANFKRHALTVHPGKSVNYTKVMSKETEAKVQQMYKKISKSDTLKKDDGKLLATVKKRQLSPEELGGPTPKKAKIDVKPHTPVKNIVPKSLIDSDTKIDTNDTRDETQSLKYQVGLDPSGTRYFKCSMCDFKAEKKIKLRLHLANHGSRFFKCFYCDYTTKLVTNACRHVEQKHGSSPMKIVNKKTKEVLSPVKKLGIEQLNQTSSVAGNNSESMKRGRRQSSIRYCCNKCPKVYEGLFLYRRHLASHSGFTYLSEASGLDSKLSCGYCAYIASDNYDFSNHISTHLEMRRLKCGYCHFSDHSKKQVRTHIKNAHPGQPENITDTTQTRSKDIQFKLVNFDPQVVLKRLNLDKWSPIKRKKVTGMIVETDSDSSVDVEKDVTEKPKTDYGKPKLQEIVASEIRTDDVNSVASNVALTSSASEIELASGASDLPLASNVSDQELISNASDLALASNASELTSNASDLALTNNDSNLAFPRIGDDLASTSNVADMALTSNESEMASPSNDTDMALTSNDSDMDLTTNDFDMASASNATDLAMTSIDSDMTLTRNASDQELTSNASDLALTSNASNLASTSNDSELTLTSKAPALVLTSNASDLVLTSNVSDLALTSNDSELALTSKSPALTLTSNDTNLVSTSNTSELALASNASDLALTSNASDLAVTSNASEMCEESAENMSEHVLDSTESFIVDIDVDESEVRQSVEATRNDNSDLHALDDDPSHVPEGIPEETENAIVQETNDCLSQGDIEAVDMECSDQGTGEASNDNKQGNNRNVFDTFSEN